MYSALTDLSGSQPADEEPAHQLNPGTSHAPSNVGGAHLLLPLLMSSPASSSAPQISLSDLGSPQTLQEVREGLSAEIVPQFNPGPSQIPNYGGAHLLLPLMMPPASPSASLTDMATSSPSTSMPPPNAGPIRRRRFSTARIQPTRIKKVMQADEEIGRMVQSVPVAIGRAMEHFAEKFLLATAQATLATNNRTLTPAHMKQAMLNNPYFYFLEPLLREIAVPGKVGMGLESPTDMVPPQLMNSPLAQSPVTPLTPGQFPFTIPPIGIYNPILASTLAQQLGMQVGMASQGSPSVTDNAPVNSSPLPSVEPKKVSYKRSTSGPVDTTDAPSEKPKRGRPRKIKKDEKCIDDDLCKEVTSNIEKEDKDRELMPPPALPVGMNFGRAKPFA